MKMKAIILILVCSFQISLVYSQEKYFFNIPSLKNETIVANNKQGTSAISYSAKQLIYNQEEIFILKKGKKIILSNSLGNIGTASSKKFKKLSIDDYTYKLISGKKKLSYIKTDEKKICGIASYEFTDKGINVEIESCEPKIVPFLFLSTLAHINGTIDSEAIVNITLLDLLNTLY